MTRKHLWILSALAAASLTLVACGGDDDDGDSVGAGDITGPGGDGSEADGGANVTLSLSDGVFGAALTIGGTAADYTTDNPAQAPAIPITGLGDQRFLSLGGGLPGTASNVQLRMLPIGQTGSYTCGDGPSSFRLVHVYLVQDGVTYRAEGDVGSCSISVSRADDLYEGTFSGAFVNGDGATLTATGSFRNDGSSL